MYCLADFLVKALPDICTPLPELAQTCSQENVFDAAENVNINQSLLDKFEFPEGVELDFSRVINFAEQEEEEQASPPSSTIDLTTTTNTSNIFEAFPPSAILTQTQQFGALFNNFIDESQFPDELNMAKFYFSDSNPSIENFMECEEDTDGSSLMDSFLFCNNNQNTNFDNYVLNLTDDKSSKNRSSRSADKHCSSRKSLTSVEENVRYTPYPNLSKYPSPEIALDLITDMEKHSDNTNGLVTPPLYSGDIVYSMPTLPMPSLPINHQHHHIGCGKEEELFNYEQQQSQQLPPPPPRRPSAVSVNGRRKRQSQIDCGPTFDTEGKPIPICKWGDCRQVFDTMENLVNHVDVCHVESGKPFYHCGWMSCERNGKPFPKRHKLFTHLRTHTGERPYPCTVPNCGRWFSRSDSLNSHKKVKHGIGI